MTTQANPDLKRKKAAGRAPVESQWSIVARQFRKKRSAVWGMRITFALVLTAIYAPLIASADPFVWRADGGSLQFPWFANLFDVNTWEQSLDRLFNLMMVSLTFYAVWALILVLVRRLAGPSPGLTQTRKVSRWVFLGGTALVGLVQLFLGGFLASRPKIDYRASIQAVKNAEDVAWAGAIWHGMTERLRTCEMCAPEREVLDARDRLQALGSSFGSTLAARLGDQEREWAASPETWLEALRAKAPSKVALEGTAPPAQVVDAWQQLTTALEQPNLAYDQPAREARRVLQDLVLAAEQDAALLPYYGALLDTWNALVPPSAEWLGAARGIERRARVPEQATADAKLAAAHEVLEATLAVRTIIPYGYREQLPSASDKFRGFLDFKRHEAHLLGTDEIGRDIFTRILYGTRISLTIGLVAVSIYVTIGTILGALAGYFFGKKIDTLIMRLVEIMICIPQLFLLLTIVALFEQKSIFLIMFAIGLVSWTGVTRLVRGEFIRERNIEYVVAAKAMGFKAPRILFRHILPNAMGPVLVAATFGVASAILVESGLSFLGMGDVTVPSWGAILNHGRENQYWHLILPPSVAIFITVTALNLVGDGLRDALDPKLRD